MHGPTVAGCIDASEWGPDAALLWRCGRDDGLTGRGGGRDGGAAIAATKALETVVLALLDGPSGALCVRRPMVGAPDADTDLREASDAIALLMRS